MPEHVLKDTCAAYRAGMEDKMKEHAEDIQRLYTSSSAIGKKFIAILTGIIMLLLTMVANMIIK